MRSRIDLFTINGQPMFAPDEEVGMSFEDLDSADSGRTESGEMFRVVVRYKVGTWSFEYSSITSEEMKIQEAFARMMEGRTSFIVAHRLSTIREADMILVMRDGSVVETGTHNELVEKGGFYASLWNSQFAV